MIGPWIIYIVISNADVYVFLDIFWSKHQQFWLICQEMEKKEKMKAARNEKSLVSVKSKVEFLDTEGNKSFLGENYPTRPRSKNIQ